MYEAPVNIGSHIQGGQIKKTAPVICTTVKKKTTKIQTLGVQNFAHVDKLILKTTLLHNVVNFYILLKNAKKIIKMNLNSAN